MSLAVLADHMASKGRGPDSMLIHMSPREVQGLQALAVKNGGSLTINPDTGLPEAGFLDKLLPTIIGAGLSMIPGVGPMMAAGIVGGIQTVRTGDIGKGLAAGLGAYGGAGLAQGLSTAGASALGSEAALGAGIPADIAANLTDAGVSTANADLASQAIQQAQPSMFDKMSAGFNSATSSPEAMGQFAKDNAKNLMYAAGPAIMAGTNVQAKGPQTVTKPGMIRPSSFDPYSGTYISASPYEAAPTRAAGGGLMGMADGGYNPGQLDFAQRSEPVVRMAGGGISDQQVVDWFKANPGAKDTDIAAAMQQYGVDPSQVARATGTQDQLADYEKRYQTATNQNILAAADQFGPLSTGTQGGTGTAGIADWMDKSGISAQEYATALESRFGAPSAGSTTNPYTAEGIQALYNNATMVGNQADIINAASPIKDVHDPVNDKVWAKWMDENGIDVSEAARAFGLSDKEVQARYDAAKKTPKKPTAFVNPVTGGTINPPTRVTDTVLPTDPTVNAPPGTKNPYGGPNTPGDKTYNPDGSITVTPNIPGRPYGGFSGMDEVKNAYTAGGGSLGYIPYTPKTIEEFDAKYNKLTGGSKQAYDYLMGKTPYSPTPYTPTGEIMKPYFESVAGMPANVSKKMYLFDPATKTYKINPDYAIPTYDAKGNKVYNLTNKDVLTYMAAKPAPADFYNWAKTNNLTIEQIAAATGMPITEVQKMFSSGAPADTTTAATTTTNNDNPFAKGGLAALAGGGISGSGNLDLHIPLDFGGGGGGGFDGAVGTLGGGTPIPSYGGGSTFSGQNNTAGGGYGIPAGLDDSGMGSPEIIARSKANDAARAAGAANPASTFDLAKGLGLFAAGGSTGNSYNLGDYSDGGRLLRGPGDGVSDSIPASIGNKRPARLADGEFVVPARIVSELGNGSTEAGARKLYAMMDRVQAARRGSIGKGKVAKNSRADKHLPA